MTHRPIKVIIFFTITMFTSFSIGEQISQSQITRHQELTERARAIVKQFAGALKPQLQQAMQSGGPKKAVEVCSIQAQEIADKISDQTGWRVKRVSLRARNSITAQPDSWERTQLEFFDRAVTDKQNKLEASKMDDYQFRYMKAQIVEPICLTCHGKQISPDVLAVIKKHYKEDEATGYQLGDVRGAFSLSRWLE